MLFSSVVPVLTFSGAPSVSRRDLRGFFAWRLHRALLVLGRHQRSRTM
jgi:hypothetical protein